MSDMDGRPGTSPGSSETTAGGSDPLLAQIKGAETAAGTNFNAATHQLTAGFNQSGAIASAQAAIVQSDITKTDTAATQNNEKRNALVESYFSFSNKINQSLKGISATVEAQLTASFTGMIQSLLAGNLNITESLKSLGKGMASSYLKTTASGLMAHGAKSTTDGAAQAAKGGQGGAQMISTGAEMMGGAVAIKKLSQKYLAQGGVVSQPTLAMIGEGGQSEAVIPLDKLQGGQALSKPKQISQISMTFNGVRSIADISNGKLRTQATAYFKSALGTHKG